MENVAEGNKGNRGNQTMIKALQLQQINSPNGISHSPARLITHFKCENHITYLQNRVILFCRKHLTFILKFFLNRITCHTYQPMYLLNKKDH